MSNVTAVSPDKKERKINNKRKRRGTPLSIVSA
jgi:hypothetical protein